VGEGVQLLNQLVLTAYHLGVKPHTLASFYYEPTGVLRWFLPNDRARAREA